jgi:hypothetical protein
MMGQGTRDRGQEWEGTRDARRGTREKMGGRGSCRAEMTANGD